MISTAERIAELEAALADERAGAEILDEAGMDANDKLSVLAALVLDMRVANPYGQKVKAYARYVLGRGPNPLEHPTPYEHEGSESGRYRRGDIMATAAAQARLRKQVQA